MARRCAGCVRAVLRDIVAHSLCFASSQAFRAIIGIWFLMLIPDLVRYFVYDRLEQFYVRIGVRCGLLLVAAALFAFRRTHLQFQYMAGAAVTLMGIAQIVFGVLENESLSTLARPCFSFASPAVSLSLRVQTRCTRCRCCCCRRCRRPTSACATWSAWR